MLSDPGLVEPESVDVFDQLEVAVEESVGFSPAGWNGAMKIPKRIRVVMQSPHLVVCAAAPAATRSGLSVDGPDQARDRQLGATRSATTA